MADSDFNFIKPVESLPNIQGLAPAKERENSKRRQRPPGERREPPKQEEDSDDGRTAKDDRPHSIDYCA